MERGTGLVAAPDAIPSALGHGLPPRMRCTLSCVQADVDNSGTIDYTEFITATMHMNRAAKEEHIWAAFQHFDQDGSG